MPHYFRKFISTVNWIRAQQPSVCAKPRASSVFLTTERLLAFNFQPEVAPIVGSDSPFSAKPVPSIRGRVEFLAPSQRVKLLSVFACRLSSVSKASGASSVSPITELERQLVGMAVRASRSYRRRKCGLATSLFPTARNG